MGLLAVQLVEVAKPLFAIDLAVLLRVNILRPEIAKRLLVNL